MLGPHGMARKNDGESSWAAGSRFERNSLGRDTVNTRRGGIWASQPVFFLFDMNASLPPAKTLPGGYVFNPVGWAKVVPCPSGAATIGNDVNIWDVRTYVGPVL